MIWSTSQNAITCCPTHGKRCRRPGLGRGSLLVRKYWCASSLACMIWEQGGSYSTWLAAHQCKWPRTHCQDLFTHPHKCLLFIFHCNKMTWGQGLHKDISTAMYWFYPRLESNHLELYNVFHNYCKYLKVYTGSRSYFLMSAQAFLSTIKQMTTGAKPDWGYHEKLKVSNHNGFPGFCGLLHPGCFTANPTHKHLLTTF